MYLSELVVENFRCFGGEDKKQKLPLQAGQNTLVGLTRPFLAIPESHKQSATRNITWTSQEFEILKVHGWKVARVRENCQLDFI